LRSSSLHLDPPPHLGGFRDFAVSRKPQNERRVEFIVELGDHLSWEGEITDGGEERILDRERKSQPLAVGNGWLSLRILGPAGEERGGPIPIRILKYPPKC